MMSNHGALLGAFVAGAVLPLTAWWWTSRQSGEDEYDSDDDENNNSAAAPSQAGSWSIAHAPYKMILAVNTGLGMGKGKIAAQCGHASVGCFTRAQSKCPRALAAWNRTGCAKIAVKVGTTDELEILAVEASKRGVPFYLVEDAGRTQIAAGSKTVLALFAPVSAFEGFTNHLKLL